MIDFDNAAAFVAKAHAGQTYGDSDIPYLFHLFEVAGKVRQIDPSLAGLALLHDVLEDTTYRIPYYRLTDNPSTCLKVLDVLDLLTRDKSDTYREYITRIDAAYRDGHYAARMARIIKLCDLYCNYGHTVRSYPVTDKVRSRMRKYEGAFEVLLEVAVSCDIHSPEELWDLIVEETRV